MIRERVLEIVSIENEAGDIVQQARDSAADAVKSAQRRAAAIISEARNSRKGVVEAGIREAEQRGTRDAEQIRIDSETRAAEIAAEARMNFEKAVNKVLERIPGYGNQ